MLFAESAIMIMINNYLKKQASIEILKIIDSNPQSLSSLTNNQPFGQSDQMIELSFGYLSVRCI